MACGLAWLAPLYLLAAAATGLADELACGSSEQARALARLIIDDPGQRRRKLACNGLLSAIASDRARELARLGQVTHLGRSAANRRLIEAGYPLSPIYPRQFENNVEAIAGGLPDAGAVWAAFRDSPAHRAHLLGEHEFYLLQDELGVGFHADPATPHIEYWVVYVAHRVASRGYRGPVAESKD